MTTRYVVSYTKGDEKYYEQFMTVQEARYRIEFLVWEPRVSLVSLHAERVEKHTGQEVMS